MVRTIGVVSGKGGVGKTTVALNLALALHNLGENTLLVDANLESPHLQHYLSGLHTEHTIHDVLAGRSAHTQAVQLHPSGLKIVCGSPNPKEALLDTALLRYYSKAAPFVIYDAPPGKAKHVHEHAQHMLIVTQPQRAAVADAFTHLIKAQENYKTIVGVVVNGHGMMSNEAIEDYMRVPVIARIPPDDKFLQAAQQKMPYLSLYPKQKAAQVYRELAARIAVKPLL